MSTIRSRRNQSKITHSSYQYYKQFSRELKPMSPEEEAQVCKRAAAGDKSAVDILIMKNIYLAEKVALDTVQKTGMFNLADDLIQAGVFGLSKAAQEFDPNKGVKFATYATHAIEHEVQDELQNQTHAVAIQRDFYYGVYTKVANFRNEYANTHEGSFPAPETVCQELGITKEQYDIAMNARAANNAASMDETMNDSNSDDKDLTFGDTIEDSSTTSFTEDVELKDTIRDALSCLSERNREIVKMRFGLDGQQESSLNDIADLFGLSFNRVSEIIKKSLKDMEKHLTRAERSHDDWDR